MSCEICGRGACSRSFHSMVEQQEFDETFDEFKQTAAAKIGRRLDNLNCITAEDEFYIPLSEALEIVDDVLG